MANKNTAGNTLMRARTREQRLVDIIDKRDDKSDNMENVDHVWQQHTTNDNGERTWTF